MSYQTDLAAAAAANPREAMGANLGPPLDLRDRLETETIELRDEVDAIAKLATGAPKVIKSPNDLAVVAKLVMDARALWNKADAHRARVKKPYLDAERDVQAHFAVFLERLQRISEAFNRIGTDYQREQARLARLKAQAQADAARAEEQRARDAAALAAKPTAAIQHQARAEAAADRAQVAETTVVAKASDLTRTRTSDGVVATATTKWVGTVTDWATIDLAALRPYLKRDAIEAALNQAVRMGVRSIRGAEIKEDTKASFR